MYRFACLQCDMWIQNDTVNYRNIICGYMWLENVGSDVSWWSVAAEIWTIIKINYSMRVSFWTQLIECLIIEDIRSCHTKKHCRSISASQRASHHSFQFGGETLQVCLAFRANLKLSIMEAEDWTTCLPFPFVSLHGSLQGVHSSLSRRKGFGLELSNPKPLWTVNTPCKVLLASICK